MIKKISGLIVLFFSVLSIVTAQPSGTVVTFKFHPGEISKYKISGSGNGTLLLSSIDTSMNAYGVNSTFQVNLSFEAYVTASTLSISSEGNGTFDMRIGKIDLSGGIPGQQFRFAMDTHKVQIYNNGQLLTEQSMDSAGQPSVMDKSITFTFDKRGKLLDMKSPELDELKKSSQATTFNFDYWKSMAQPFLPDKPLAAGDHWESTTKIEFPANIFVLSKPFQVINSFTVDTFKMIDGENCLVLKTGSNNDFTGISISMDTSNFPMASGMGKIETKFKVGKINANGEIVMGVNSGKLIKCSGDQNVNIELAMQVPVSQLPITAFSLTAKGTLNSTIELQP